MSRLAAALLVLGGIVHVVLGVSAIAGTARLEVNVQAPRRGTRDDLNG